MLRTISIVISTWALLAVPAARAVDALPDAVWGQSRWGECRWTAESAKAKKRLKCKNKAHYSKNGKHYFVLGESRFGDRHVLIPNKPPPPKPE